MFLKQRHSDTTTSDCEHYPTNFRPSIEIHKKMKIEDESSMPPTQYGRDRVVKHSILVTHYAVGYTNGAISQSNREGNDIALGRQNLTKRCDDGVFVDLNIDDDDDEENTTTSKSTSPTPTPIADNANMSITTDDAAPDATNSVTPTASTGKEEGKGWYRKHN